MCRSPSFQSVLTCRQCPERQCSEQQCAPAFSGMVSPWSVHGVSPGRSWSVPGRSWSVPGHSRVAHGRFMMSVPDVSPQFQSWVRHLRHARMPLRYLWAGVPCRRGPRALFIDRLGIGSVPVCHAGMALEHLWAGEPCRRPVRSPPSPRGDATEIPVDRGAVPKTGHKNSLARDNLYLMGAALFPCAREHTPL